MGKKKFKPVLELLRRKNEHCPSAQPGPARILALGFGGPGKIPKYNYRDGGMRSEKKLLTFLTSVMVLGSIVGLTSCGGGDNENVSRLSEVEAALVQAKERTDEAALARAQASGASSTTIAALEQTVAADEAELTLFGRGGPRMEECQIYEDNGKLVVTCIRGGIVTTEYLN